MVDVFPYVMLYGRNTRFGMESTNALPALLYSGEAAMRLSGATPYSLWDGICQRSHEKRQRAQAPGPLYPDTLDDNIVTRSLADMEAFLNSVGHDLAQAKVFARQVTGTVDGTDMETPARYEGCGQAARQRKITDKRGKVREVEVTVRG